jgi:hypothetical protein
MPGIKWGLPVPIDFKHVPMDEHSVKPINSPPEKPPILWNPPSPNHARTNSAVAGLGFAEHRATAWNERRKHAPWSEAVPPAWDLDALYLRHPDEREYCDRLRQLRVGESVTSISTDLVCLPSPWVPHRWLPPQHRIEVNRNRYPGTRYLTDPRGSDMCLDSAWQLRVTSIEGGTGEPG